MSELFQFLGVDYNLGVVLTGVSLLGAAAGVIGCFALLRGRALTGDALAHAALPGLCLSFLIAGERNMPTLLAGALGSGLAGIAVLAGLRRWTRLKEDAALGIVLSLFFGLGLVLLTVIQGLPEGSRAGLKSFIFGKAAGMLRDDLVWLAALAALTLMAVLLLFKEFRLVSFDDSFARVQGWPAGLLDFLQMLLIVVAVVIGLPVVGVVLMAALLVIPAAAARLWTERLGVMLTLAAGFGLAAGVAGTLVSARFERASTGPCIILVGAGIFLVSLGVAPRRGLLSRLWLERRLRMDAVRRRWHVFLYGLAKKGLKQGATFTAADLAGYSPGRPRLQRLLLRQALHEGELLHEGAQFSLTQKGLRRAWTTARNERLWKLFVRDFSDLARPLLHVDRPDLTSLVPPEIMEELVLALESEEGEAALSPGREQAP